jgi:signal transduction histidine kinase
MVKRQSTSISGHLTRMNLLVSAVALVLASSGFVAYDFISFRLSIVRNLSMQAQLAGSNSVAALVFDDPESAGRTLGAFGVSGDVLASCIYNVNGQPFATYLRDKAETIPAMPQIAPDQEEAYRFEGGRVILAHTITFEGKRTGYILVEQDMESIVARVKTYLTITALMLVLSLLVALFVSRIARRAIANPVIKLADTARRVSEEKNYYVRVEPGNEQGELAVLVETFNQMLEQLEERDRRLQAAHDLLEKRVEERTAQLVASNKELESFSYSVSHDLRAPLRSIDGFSLALEEDYGDRLDDQAKNYIQRVRGATQRMGMLIDDLLNLSRVTRAEIRKERVDLSGMAKSVACELARADGDRHVDWVIDDGIEAFGDSRLLRIVLDNLLGNAWKYTSKHDHARIQFSQQRHNGCSAFFVKDDGAGFDPAYTQRLFGAFQRLHGMTEFSGTGVGLATVQRIIHRHGGEVWAEGAVEKGATFYFTI